MEKSRKIKKGDKKKLDGDAIFGHKITSTETGSIGWSVQSQAVNVYPQYLPEEPKNKEKKPKKEK